MSSFLLRALATAGAVGALSCTSSTRPTGLQITTDRASYDFVTSSGPLVRVVFVNASTQTVLLAACGNWVAHVLEKETGGQWDDATRESCGPTPYEPFALASGDSLRTGVNPITVGRFRVRAALYGDGTKVTLSRETSPPFEIR